MHEAPSQPLRDTQNVTVMGHEWSNPLPNSKKQEPYDFIRRLMSRLRTQDTEEFQLLKQT